MWDSGSVTHTSETKWWELRWSKQMCPWATSQPLRSLCHGRDVLGPSHCWGGSSVLRHHGDHQSCLTPAAIQGTAGPWTCNMLPGCPCTHRRSHEHLLVHPWPAAHICSCMAVKEIYLRNKNKIQQIIYRGFWKRKQKCRQVWSLSAHCTIY